MQKARQDKQEKEEQERKQRERDLANLPTHNYTEYAFFLTLCGVGAFLAVWQYKRYFWKVNLIDTRTKQLEQSEPQRLAQLLQEHGEGPPPLPAASVPGGGGAAAAGAAAVTAQEGPAVAAANNEASEATTTEDPVDCRKVFVSGTFDYEKQVLVGIRSNPEDEKATKGYWLHTPLCLDDDSGAAG
jgi:cytochrome oxidase assembly protein ShyY1